MVIISLILLVFFSYEASGKSEARIVKAFYGEKNFQHYYGPSDLEYEIDQGLGIPSFLSDDLRKNYFYDLSDYALRELTDSFEETQIARLCPNKELAENHDYMRYLYRLAALSYLDEHLRSAREKAKKMRLGEVCATELPEILSQCDPKGEDMALFVKSAKVLSKNFEEPEVAYDFPYQEYKENWLKEFRNGAQDSVSSHVRSNCKEKDCFSKSKKNLEKAFQGICRESKENFIRICSERDSLMGISRVVEAHRSINSSDAIVVINKAGNGAGCLARFSSLLSAREKRMPEVELVIRNMYQELKTEKGAGSLSGRLFPAGSLKRFAEQGLGSIFIQKKSPKKETKKAVEKTEEAIELAPLAPEPIKQVFKKKEKKKEEKPKEKVVKKEEPKKSHFLETAETRADLNLESAKVDMLKFKYDYVFNAKMLSYLKEEMGRFSTRKGLAEMRRYDHLGKAKGPVPLLFIKYLIEDGRHQALFNLTDVIGEDFYVVNNIDPPGLRREKDFVKLEFDQDSPLNWQIYVLDPPEEGEDG